MFEYYKLGYLVIESCQVVILATTSLYHLPILFFKIGGWVGHILKTALWLHYHNELGERAKHEFLLLMCKGVQSHCLICHCN